MNQPIFHLFASYRREDDVGHVGRAIDYLNRHLRIGTVFQDVGLPPGTRLDTLLDWVRTSRLLVAFIGPHWAVSPDGSSRFSDEYDWVRREIATALAEGIPILPVRLPNTRVPSIQELPADMRPVVNITAAKLDADDWPYYMGKLTAAVEAHIADPSHQLFRNNTVHGWGGRLRLGYGPATGLVINAVLSALHVSSWQTDGPTSPPNPQPGWARLSAVANADGHFENIEASIFPTRPEHLKKGLLKQIGLHQLKLANFLRDGPMYVNLTSQPTAMWEGWEQRNRYNVGAVVAQLKHLAAQQGVAVEHNRATPLGPVVYDFQPL